MARQIEFLFEGQSFACTIDKVDRAQLYGSVDIETSDQDGRPCRTMNLASDGKTLIPSGNTAFAYMSEDGRWIERADLVPVDAHGNRLNSVPSSFSHPVELDARTTSDRFLEHKVRLVYALDPVGGDLPAQFVKAVDAGDIFKFDFSYRGGIDPDPAFVMKGGDGTVWLLVGDECNVNSVGFEPAAGLDPEDDERDAEADDFDFDMM